MIKAQVAQAGAIAINPMTGEQVEFFPWLGDEERESALRAAGTGFRTWSAWSVEQRAAVLRRVGRYFKDNVERFARTITLEMGKPITQARAEAEKCAAL